MSVTSSQFRHVWLTASNGGHFSALINGQVGWLMYMREDGDADLYCAAAYPGAGFPFASSLSQAQSNP